MLTIELPEEIENRIAALADAANRSKDEYVQEILERLLEDIEDAHAADEAYAEYLASGKKATPLEEVMKEYGMEV